MWDEMSKVPAFCLIPVPEFVSNAPKYKGLIEKADWFSVSCGVSCEGGVKELKSEVFGGERKAWSVVVGSSDTAFARTDQRLRSRPLVGKG